ncbi:hypothetical protein E3N88_43246 [Mikania micrantha]|uniref:Integrase catalytic domain-containing protein n=1 Tax=Mikania micrantha TaxID=192012 RepID=A0A5N6LFK2_9ASTR|nr:hypothetical protein E3N88_43246 [Mikania micrantha]
MVQKGYDIHFKKNGVCLIRNSQGILVGKVNMTENKMFPIHFQENMLSLNMAVSENSKLWHSRFGHVNYDSLTHMGKENIVKDLPVIRNIDSVCDSCVLGKHARKSFSKSTWRATKPLEMVHSDICGPMKTPTINGNRYVITFIDDFSRKNWLYFIKEKAEAFSYFKTFKIIAENQSGERIKGLRTDRGGEYCGNEFQNFLRENGILHQLTTSYTPQQNGVAERRNRSLLNLARSMLKHKNMPDDFWGEAVACAAYIINRTITKSLENMTPKEAWTGFKPSVWHFKVFGCIAYARIPNQRRTKLESKSEKCIFVGYSEQSKAFKLFNPDSQKVIISRDVVFDESKGWFEEINSADNRIFDTGIMGNAIPEEEPAKIAGNHSQTTEPGNIEEITEDSKGFKQKFKPSNAYQYIIIKGD